MNATITLTIYFLKNELKFWRLKLKTNYYKPKETDLYYIYYILKKKHLEVSESENYSITTTLLSWLEKSCNKKNLNYRFKWKNVKILGMNL